MTMQECQHLQPRKEPPEKEINVRILVMSERVTGLQTTARYSERQLELQSTWLCVRELN